MPAQSGEVDRTHLHMVCYVICGCARAEEPVTVYGNAQLCAALRLPAEARRFFFCGNVYRIWHGAGQGRPLVEAYHRRGRLHRCGTRYMV